MDYSVFFTALLTGGVISTIIGVIANRHSTESSTYERLSKTVDTLRANFDEEVLARKRDRKEAEEEIVRLEKEWRDKLELIKEQAEIEVLAAKEEIIRLEKEWKDKLEKVKVQSEREIHKVREMYQVKLEQLENRVLDLERERNNLLVDNHKLRQRIKGLEEENDDSV